MDSNATSLGIRSHSSLSHFLSRLGYNPIQRSGSELCYHSMITDTTGNNKLLVNEELDVWYDKASGKSGSLLDFGLAYWPHLPVAEVLAKIKDIISMPLAQVKASGRKRKAVKIPHYRLAGVLPLGQNAEIMLYLQRQGYWEIAAEPLREVYYYVTDQKRHRKDFFAAGWPNENGGWELRARNYSGCLGPKGMTFIPHAGNSLAIFSDLFTFLIWRYKHQADDCNILILNYPEFIPAAISRASKFNDVRLCVSDEAVADQIRAVLPHAYRIE